MRPEYYCYPKHNLTVRLVAPLDPSLIAHGCVRSMVHRLAVAAGYVDRTSDLPHPCGPIANAQPLDPGSLEALLA